MPDPQQNFANHARFVPVFHYVAGPILLLNLVVKVWGIRDLSFPAVVDLLVAAALMILFYYVRVFALRVQGRVIRLEMRLRMRELLPDDLQDRIDDFTPTQMVGLRFAGDAELPGLARKVLDENVTAAAPIKKLVTDWRADHHRV